MMKKKNKSWENIKVIYTRSMCVKNIPTIKTIKEDSKVVLGSGRPLVIKSNASRREGNRAIDDMAFLARGCFPDQEN